MLFLPVFILAQLGWFCFIKSYYEHSSQIPLIMVSVQSLVLYAAGFINQMRLCSWILIACGCLMLIFTAARKKLHFSAPSVGLTVFLLGLLWAFAVTWDRVCYIWSDFSHWMRYAKALKLDGGFPTAALHNEIRFSSYPPGSSIFIVYLLDFLPAVYVSGKALMGMKILQLAGFCAMVSPLEQLNVSKKVKFICAGLLFVLTFGLTQYTYSLMVDLLLGLLSAGAVCMLISMHNSKQGSILWIVPVLCYIILVKNSAVVFVLFVLLFYVGLQWEKGQHERNRKTLMKAVGIFSCALLFFGTWVIFSRHAFPEIDESGQALSLQRFLSIFTAHGIGFYKEFIVTFCSALFSVKYRCTAVLWVLTAITGVLYFLARKRIPDEDKAQLKRLFWLTCLCDAVYIFSLFCSYTFSFSEEEAKTVASFARYLSTGIVVHLAVLSYLCLRMCVFLPKSLRQKALAALLAASLVLIAAKQMYTFVSPALECSERYRISNEPVDWHVRKLMTATPDEPQRVPGIEYALWLVDRTGEPPLPDGYKFTSYGKYMVSEYLCIPRDSAAVIDIGRNSRKTVDSAVEKFKDKENSVVILSDLRPEAIELAESLNIPILYPQGYTP